MKMPIEEKTVVRAILFGLITLFVGIILQSFAFGAIGLGLLIAGGAYWYGYKYYYEKNREK